jgi:hypothetical protein
MICLYLWFCQWVAGDYDLSREEFDPQGDVAPNFAEEMFVPYESAWIARVGTRLAAGSPPGTVRAPLNAYGSTSDNTGMTI